MPEECAIQEVIEVPLRKDLKSVLLIGSGPIVIGQACEFDYSGTQALKALREEGLRLILVNSNPATIMTDPELADRTYIEPMTAAAIAQIIEHERPDALLPTVGGQTALNLAIELAEAGVLERYGVELIGANLAAIKKAEDRDLFKQAMIKIGLEVPASAIAHSEEEAERIREQLGLAADYSPLAHAGRNRRLDRARARRFSRQSALGPRNVAQPRGPDRGIGRGLEGIRARGDARHGRQRRDRLLDRKSRSDGRAYRRLDYGRAGADPDRQGIPDHARRGAAHHPRNRRRHRRLEYPVRDQSGDGRMVVIEMNPRVSRSSALASKATGFPIAKIAARLAVGYRLDEIPNDITRMTPACFEPTIDYVVTKIPRFTFEKFRGAADELGPQMKSVGEVMAIGRTFKESLQKALRSLEIGS